MTQPKHPKRKNTFSKNAVFAFLFLLLFVIIIRKCSFHQLPKEKFSLFKLDIDQTYSNNEFRITIKNTVDCPMRFLLSARDESINEILMQHSQILLEGKADTVISISDKGDLKNKIDFRVKYGNPNLPISSKKMESLPYAKGKSYKLLQGNNSNPTHNSTGSRYAFDFTMEIGDTVTSTQNGYVVGMVEGYKGWGRSNKWKSFGNQLIIYDPSSYLFTQYGHLKQNGSLVELGDFVKIGQPIGISGRTGQSPEPHLHYNVFRAGSRKGGLVSFPLDSIGNYKVKDLTRYQLMTN